MAKPWEEYKSQASGPWQDYQEPEPAPAPVTPVSQPMPQASAASAIPRQMGLTARDIIEGGADTIGLLSDPVAATINAVSPGQPIKQSASDLGRTTADWLGLPKPENSLERGVNDTAKLLVGTGATIKGFEMMSKVASGALAKAARILSSNAGMQASSTIGSGTVGNMVKENDGGPVEQFIGALVGGVAAPALTKTVATGLNAAQGLLTPSNVDAQVQRVVENAGVTIDQLPKRVQQQLRDDVTEALKTGQNLSPDAIRRLADYKTVGASPMRSSLTLDPSDVTREQNLVKMAANSKDPAANKLATMRRDNQQTLIAGINELGAENADDAYNAGAKMVKALNDRDAAAKVTIDKLYQAARDTQGRAAKLDPSAFTQRAGDLLDQNLLNSAVPADVRNTLNKVAAGEIPLTVDVAEQLKTNIGKLQRASNDGTTRLALGYVRQALDETPLLDGQGEEAIKAFNKARRVNRAYMSVVDQTPALKAVRDGMEPDKFVQKFITSDSATLKDLDNLRKVTRKNAEASKVIREQIVLNLKNKATSGNPDEVASFSPASFNKELEKIGEKKLRLFFTEEEVQKMKAIGRVAYYEKTQPSGSAVNNSNTAATALTWLDNVVRKVPFGALGSNAVKDVATNVSARRAQNVTKALQSQVKPTKEKLVPVGTLLYGASLGGASE